jgi:hypothetical protein
VGLKVSLTTERGEILDSIDDPTNELHRMLSSTAGLTLLKYVDWYGDTVFNRLQMPQFRREWSILEGVARQQGAEEVHERIASMAARCAEEVHLYVKFEGD